MYIYHKAILTSFNCPNSVALRTFIVLSDHHRHPVSRNFSPPPTETPRPLNNNYPFPPLPSSRKPRFYFLYELDLSRNLLYKNNHTIFVLLCGWLISLNTMSLHLEETSSTSTRCLFILYSVALPPCCLIKLFS